MATLALRIAARRCLLTSARLTSARQFTASAARLEQQHSAAPPPPPTDSAGAKTKSKINMAEGLAAQALYSRVVDEKQKAASSHDAAGDSATKPAADSADSGAVAEGEPSPAAQAVVTTIFVSALIGGAYWVGRPDADDADQSWSPVSYWNRSVTRLASFYHQLSAIKMEKLLPDPLPAPYQPPYTLVINMDDTLVRSEWDVQHGWRVKKRAGVDNFLAYMAQFYEIVVFTSSPAHPADDVLTKSDPYRHISFRLYRDATDYVKGTYVKDLSKLNRDLRKVIILDIDKKRFSRQPDNGVLIPRWTGDPQDKRLLEFVPFLEMLALSNVDDVRPILRSYSDTYLPDEFAQRRAIYERKALDEQRKQEAERASRQGSGFLSGLLGGGIRQSIAQRPADTNDLAKQIQTQFLKERDEMEARVREHLQKEEKQMKEAMAQMKGQKTTLLRLLRDGPPLPPQPSMSS
ncbi:mitochondrial inner membrane protein required for protein import [Sorochytrium milnesiophthora]